MVSKGLSLDIGLCYRGFKSLDIQLATTWIMGERQEMGLIHPRNLDLKSTSNYKGKERES